MKRKVQGSQIRKAFQDLAQYIDGNFKQIGETLGMSMEIQAALLRVLGPETEEKVKEQVKAQIKEREEKFKAETAKSKELTQNANAQDPSSPVCDEDKTAPGIDPDPAQDRPGGGDSQPSG